MDVSAKTIREVEFRERLRGYNQEEVDDFLERVAAGIEILQERLHQATQRAARAEEQARETAEGDEAIRQMLVFARRTADLAVQEARDQAAGIVEAAQSRAQSIVEEAGEEARRLAEQVHAQVWADLGRLEAARERLREDVANLERHLDEERARVRASLAEAARRLEESLPAPSPAPAVHEIDLTAISRPQARPAPMSSSSSASSSAASSASSESSAGAAVADDEALFAELHRPVSPDASPGPDDRHDHLRSLLRRS